MDPCLVQAMDIANIEVEKQSYSLGICGVIYKRKTQRESNSFELCPKCRRDFERFMRNEHGRSN